MKLGFLEFALHLRQMTTRGSLRAMYQVIVMSLFLPFLSIAANEAPYIDQMRTQLLKSPVQVTTKKSVTSDLMGTTKTYEGKLSVQKGRINWSTVKPNREDFIYDGSQLYHIRFPRKGREEATQVMITPVDLNQNPMFRLLLNKSQWQRDFKLSNTTGEKGIIKYTLLPKRKNVRVKQVAVEINLQLMELKRISYVDEIDNSTAIDFGKFEHKKELPKELFEYKKPEGAKEARAGGL